MSTQLEPSRVEGDTEEARLTWQGSAGSYLSPPDANIGYGVQVEWLEDRSQRQTTDVRVENPEDPEQYVNVERIDKMVLKNTKTAEEIQIKPSWD